MRTVLGLVVFTAGAIIGITSLALTVLWFRTADVVRAFRLD
jgi:hypothetical protein